MTWQLLHLLPLQVWASHVLCGHHPPPLQPTGWGGEACTAGLPPGRAGRDDNFLHRSPCPLCLVWGHEQHPPVSPAAVHRDRITGLFPTDREPGGWLLQAADSKPAHPYPPPPPTPPHRTRLPVQLSSMARPALTEQLSGTDQGAPH